MKLLYLYLAWLLFLGTGTDAAKRGHQAGNVDTEADNEDYGEEEAHVAMPPEGARVTVAGDEEDQALVANSGDPQPLEENWVGH